MSEAAVPSRDAERLRTLGLAALVLLVGIATVVAVVAGANPGLAVVPVALVAALWGMALAPLRASAAVLLFLVLALEVSSDAIGLWHTPLATLGDLLQENLERSAKLPGVALSGLEVVTLYLLGVAAFQRRSRPAVQLDGVARAPRVVWGFLLLYVAGVAWTEAIGLARGNGSAIWKVRQLLDVPLLAVLFITAFRGPRDHRLIGQVVILAATVKALLAVWVQRVAGPALTGGKLEYATNHGDSVLFALAAFILLAQLFEGRSPRRAVVAAVFLPVVLVGMHENARRTAWVMLWMSALAAYFVTPPRRWKRALSRAVLVGAPILALYVAVGWDRDGRLFAPIRTLRTLSDATIDSSTRWREVENWNISMSIREHPILGTGLGAQYTEFVKGDDISASFADFRAWPHNSVLGLLLFAGPFGFTAISALLGLVVFLAVRSYRLAASPEDRVAALACVATVIACSVLAYGDTGAHFAHYRVLLGLAIAVSGKLAVATGAWPTRAGRTRVAVGAAPGGA